LTLLRAALSLRRARPVFAASHPLGDLTRDFAVSVLACSCTRSGVLKNDLPITNSVSRGESMTKLFSIASVAAVLLVSAVTTKADDAAQEAKIKANLDKLPAADRAVAEAQKFCAVQTGNRLGSMGPPIKLEIEGKPVFLCCGGCKDHALANPKQTLATAEKLKAANAPKPKSATTN
jgi:hypothetical protein